MGDLPRPRPATENIAAVDPALTVPLTEAERAAVHSRRAEVLRLMLGDLVADLGMDTEAAPDVPLQRPASEN